MENMKGKPAGDRDASIRRWCEYGLWLAGILTLTYCAAVLLEARLYQSYQSWSFDQILQGKPGSLAGFLWHWIPGHEFNREAHAQSDRRVRPSAQPIHSGRTSKETAEGRALDHSPNDAGSVARGRSWIGRLEIPRIGLSAILAEGVDSGTLRRAVGHIPGTALPGEAGNVGVAGHRDTFFRGLGQLNKNDLIRLLTLTRAYDYRVESTEVVGPYDTQVLSASSRPTLTLVTCYPFYFVGPAPQRFIVRAREFPDRPVG